MACEGLLICSMDDALKQSSICRCLEIHQDEQVIGIAQREMMMMMMM